MKSLKVCASALAVSIMLVVSATASAATAELFAATGSGSLPSGIAIDSSGNIYTANYGSRTVSKVTPSGTVTASWASSVVSEPSNIAVGPGSAVYVTGSAQKVQKFSSGGGSPAEYSTGTGGYSDTPLQMTVDSSGNVYYSTADNTHLGKIDTDGQRTSISAFQAGGIITDSAGNVYVSDSSANVVRKYNSSLVQVTSGGWPASVGTYPAKLAVNDTYLYVGYQGGVSRVKLSDGTSTAAWSTPSGVYDRSPIAVAADGTVYVGGGPNNKVVYSISASGTSTTLASLTFEPKGIVLDSSGNVYVLNSGPMGFAPPGSLAAGVYKITLAAPTPTPSSNSSSTSTTTTTTGKPAPGPALKVTDIPAEFTLDLGSSTGGTIPADQPIVAEVPCTAPEGQLLDRCTVNVTAPEYVLLGQGDGISVRSDKKVSIGKATVKAKAGKKVIVVKVKINGKGRKALQRNLKITATVGLTAITVSNLKSTGEANTEMRLPTQLISPESGIFDSNSVSLNKAGVAFVNRLAKLLPSKPKNMVFIGFADNTGVPGDNRWLGDRRAKAVRDALAAKGVEPAKSSIETKAARSPRDDNAKQSGRERNRRVSIRITY